MNAEIAHVSDHPPDTRATGEAGVRLHVQSGVVEIVAEAGAEGSAVLTWTEGQVEVRLLGELVAGTTCRVGAGTRIDVTCVTDHPTVRYDIEPSRDRMQATLRVVPVPGVRRTLADRPAAPELRLVVQEEHIEAPMPELMAATGAVQDAGIVHGVDPEAIATAVAELDVDIVIATGTDPVEGRDGYLEPLIDFTEARLVGVASGTPLVRRIRKREGIPGRDVLGRALRVAATKEARIRAGEGVSLDPGETMAVAAVDGSPSLEEDGRVAVCHELQLDTVDTSTGNIHFIGSVRVNGDVHEARTVIARHDLVVEGNVDRAHLESGGRLEVTGSIMSSVLRAGGDRAVAATIADRVFELPKALGLVTAQARQFRDQGTERGMEVSHGLSIQLVLERMHRQVLPSILSIAEDLRDAGPAHASQSNIVLAWHRRLSTAANTSFTPERYQELLYEVGQLVDDVTRSVEERADLFVSYMQASEAEATGAVTLTGKGIFNSRIVAWDGLVAKHSEAVLRGGSILSHGPVQIRELGSPAGAPTVVQLAREGSLDAAFTHAGTVISGPGYTHRFVADRADVRVAFDTGGSMNVESLAA